MNKEKFNNIAVKAGFTTHHGWPGELFIPNHCDNLNGNLEKFKNLLLDELIKELELTKSSDIVDGRHEFHYGYNLGLQRAIERVEEIKEDKE